MMEKLLKVKSMGQENIKINMGYQKVNINILKDSFMKILLMEMEYLNGKMEKYIQGNLKQIKSMGKGK